jgi:diketogulonate reductase-like aldo/keto reductase
MSIGTITLIAHLEEEVGEAIKESGIPRSELFITSKAYVNSEYRNAWEL